MKFIDTSTITHIYIDALISTVLNCTNQTLQKSRNNTRDSNVRPPFLTTNFVYHHVGRRPETCTPAPRLTNPSVFDTHKVVLWAFYAQRKRRVARGAYWRLQFRAEQSKRDKARAASEKSKSKNGNSTPHNQKQNAAAPPRPKNE